MIRVRFKVDSDGIYRGFAIKGHAGYADAGSDIICAAVSTLSQNTVNSVEAFTDDEFTAQVDERTGSLSMNFKNCPGDASKLLLNSLALGLESIQEAYGTEYLTIVTEEV